MLAYCLLPDHVHILMKLPEEDSGFSIRMREIKRLTTLWMRKELKSEEEIWQDKFWEHTVRDEKELQIHFDYIHYNPIKHGYMDSYDGWKWSSFRDYFDDNGIANIDTEQFKNFEIGFGE